MNDKEILKTMFDRAGIRYESENGPPDEVVLRVRQGRGPKNDGFIEFYTEFYFNDEGELQSMGAWE